MKTRNRTYEISILAIFTALIILQSTVPMFGYINIIPGVPAITTVHLTVIIGAVILGPRDGSILGIVWGLVALFKAYTSPGDALSLLLFTNPIIAVVPRVLVGYVAGELYQHLSKHMKPALTMSLAGLIGALVNSVLVVLFAWLFYRSKAAGLLHTNVNNFLWVMTAAVGVNAISEAILAAIVTPLVGVPLLRFKRN
ncbi:membrane protein [Lactobacillus selangorensis]|uniref:Membrane protein n=1 Tax=Lactobacillus selangorensis TaxID=81857 RepID=A0A0R2FQJ8_9LACO|nr:ECF transporter S component [Lactobacillus selangorensis]KRN27292.1 membrane protein [Lactobacillus selangorensis]KRN29926.1 membrane protein [Lactobacillus selangorensis]